MVSKELIDDKILYIAKSSTEKKIVPNFLIEKNDKPENIKDLLKWTKTYW